MLPKDPFILLSFINTKLRDNYKNLDLLCDDMNVDKMSLSKILNDIGYYYDETKNHLIHKL